MGERKKAKYLDGAEELSAKKIRDNCYGDDGRSADHIVDAGDQRSIAELILIFFVQAKAVTTAGICTVADRLRQA